MSCIGRIALGVAKQANNLMRANVKVGGSGMGEQAAVHSNSIYGNRDIVVLLLKII